ncbi:MAG: M14 family metallopeptidase [Acidobacteriota bacterium]
MKERTRQTRGTRQVKKMVIILAFIFTAFPVLSAQQREENDVISVKKDSEVIQALREMNLDILFQREGRIFIAAGMDDFIKLDKAGIGYSIESFAFTQTSEKDIFSQGGINGAYHSYLELEKDLYLLESSYPQLAKVKIIGTTHEDRHIYAVKISDHVHLDENEASVIFMGGHHAREWISVEIPYLTAKHLLDNYSSDSEIKNLVDQSEIWIIPLVNPDGLVYSIYFYRYWRKNRRKNEDGSYGVDPNRNYGYQWGYDNIGSSPNPSSNVYRGPYPFSEPETQAVRDFMFEKNFKALVSYHNYSQIIIYPWGYTEEPSPLDDLMHDMSEQMSKKIEQVHGTFYGFGRAGDSLYLTNGDTTDWGLGVLGIPSFTIELPPADLLSGGFYNSEQDIMSIFQENLPAALYLIEWAVQQHRQSLPHPTKEIPEKLKNTKREAEKK